MKKNEIINVIKQELNILNQLFIIFNEKGLFVEDSHLIIKIAILNYMKILSKKGYKYYLVNIINLKNIQNKIKHDYNVSKYNSIKAIYNKIIYINKLILKNYYILLKI